MCLYLCSRESKCMSRDRLHQSEQPRCFIPVVAAVYSEMDGQIAVVWTGETELESRHVHRRLCLPWNQPLLTPAFSPFIPHTNTHTFPSPIFSFFSFYFLFPGGRGYWSVECQSKQNDEYDEWWSEQNIWDLIPLSNSGYKRKVHFLLEPKRVILKVLMAEINSLWIFCKLCVVCLFWFVCVQYMAPFFSNTLSEFHWALCIILIIPSCSRS